MIKVLKKWLVSRFRSDASPEQVRETILAFIEGRGGAYDWDDFLSFKHIDPQLEEVRRRCAAIEVQYPRRHPTEWTSDEGEAALRHIAAELAPNHAPVKPDAVEDVLARTADAVSVPAREIVPLDPSWQRSGRHIEFGGEYWAFPLWVGGGAIDEDEARSMGLSKNTVQRLREFARQWDETFDARQSFEALPLPTWREIDEIGMGLARTIAQELDETWTLHFLTLDDERRWAWAGGSGEQVYP